MMNGKLCQAFHVRFGDGRAMRDTQRISDGGTEVGVGNIDRLGECRHWTARCREED